MKCYFLTNGKEIIISELPEPLRPEVFLTLEGDKVHLLFEIDNLISKYPKTKIRKFFLQTLTDIAVYHEE